MPTLPSTELAGQGPYLPDAYLTVCTMTVSNRPDVDRRGKITGFSPLIIVNERVILAAAPTNGACFSSGFGPRAGRMHKGIDLQSKPASMVFSSGAGVIREVGTATGFGKQVVIDHGAGVFTRYAHLNTIEPNIVEGAAIGFGQPLGMMGRTGNATAIHLHYEVLIGAWGPRGSYGLEATNALDWPAYRVEVAS
ncbi:MAG: M23 family metallopeptidase [Pseudomonadota bacterium]